MIKTLQKRLEQIEIATKSRGKDVSIAVYESVVSDNALLVRCVDSGELLTMDQLIAKHPNGDICVLPAMPGDAEFMVEWEQGLMSQQAELKKRVAEPVDSS